MATKLSFLFVTWEGGGNVPPVLGLASSLIKRGHHVCVLAEPCLKDAINEIGADFKVFKKHFIRTDPSVDIIQDWQAKPFTIPAVDNILIRPSMDVAIQTRAAIEDAPTDIVVADFMMIGALIAAEALGIKRVALFHMPEYLPGPGRPPGGMGLLPKNTRLGRLRDKALSKVFYRVINQYLPHLNTVREAFSLPAYNSLVEVYHQADLRLIQTCKTFDAPITPAPANVRYVGAVLDDPSWIGAEESANPKDTYRLPWPKVDKRPLVVVSLSSTFQNQRSVLDRIIKGLAGADIRCLVTLGPAMKEQRFKVSENIKVLSAVPHSRIFPQADAVITHAGHGTVMRALAHGLPLVCLPMGRDQIDNAALVAHHGAGLKLSAKAGSNKIRKAIKRVLNDSDYTKNACVLQKYILADAKANIAPSHLETLACT